GPPPARPGKPPARIKPAPSAKPPPPGPAPADSCRRGPPFVARPGGLGQSPFDNGPLPGTAPTRRDRSVPNGPLGPGHNPNRLRDGLRRPKFPGTGGYQARQSPPNHAGERKSLILQV